MTAVTAFDLDCRLVATPESVPELRALIATLVAVPAAGTLRGDDIRLAVTEAVTNVVMHAYVDASHPGAIRLRARHEADGLLVLISDTGRGVTPRLDSPGLGMGMPLMARLSDELDVRSDGGGSTVSMRFALPTVARCTATRAGLTITPARRARPTASRTFDASGAGAPDAAYRQLPNIRLGR